MKILIVENDEVVARVWRRFMRGKYEVEMVGHAPEAIELLKDTSIDLAILDLRLNGPTPSGMEVYRFIRNNYPKKDIPIIIVTGLAEGTELRQEAEQAVELDIQNNCRAKLLQKAVEVKLLLSTIKDFLSGV